MLIIDDCSETSSILSATSSNLAERKGIDEPSERKFELHSRVPLQGSPSSFTNTPRVVEAVWEAMRNSLNPTETIEGF